MGFFLADQGQSHHSRIDPPFPPKGNIYIRMRDELGRIYPDEAFAPLFPVLRKPANAPACLALITIMQFVEGLTDRQAADAVRSRIEMLFCLIEKGLLKAPKKQRTDSTHIRTLAKIFYGMIKSYFCFNFCLLK